MKHYCFFIMEDREAGSEDKTGSLHCPISDASIEPRPTLPHPGSADVVAENQEQKNGQPEKSTG
jgi:hypothetical protein